MLKLYLSTSLFFLFSVLPQVDPLLFLLFLSFAYHVTSLHYFPPRLRSLKVKPTCQFPQNTNQQSFPNTH